MYTKEEASALRQKFWTLFGQYMRPVPSASGEKLNWINYKTGVKGIFFKTDADNNHALVSVDILLNDKILRQQYFELFLNFKKAFEKTAGEHWDMKPGFITEHGTEISRISTELTGVNIFRETDWPEIISFLKKNIIALDAFWNEFKPAFEII